RHFGSGITPRPISRSARCKASRTAQPISESISCTEARKMERSVRAFGLVPVATCGSLHRPQRFAAPFDERREHRHAIAVRVVLRQCADQSPLLELNRALELPRSEQVSLNAEPLHHGI